MNNVTGNSWMADDDSPSGNRRVLSVFPDGLSVMSAGDRFLCSNSCFMRLLLLPLWPPCLYAVGACLRAWSFIGPL